MHRETGDSMLKMSLNKIRGNIQVYPENWVNLSTTNCYAYALGLDIKESDICTNAYQPGTISNTSNLTDSEYFSYSDLINGIEGDLNALNIHYREIEPHQQIALYEWKIALLIEKYYGNLLDFHFLRQKENGIWLHKNGFRGSFSKKDYLGKIITDPVTNYFSPYTYAKCYALRLNK